jgi:hypothetical protein
MICAVDKEGTVAYPFPAIEQVYVLRDHLLPLDITYDSTCPYGIKFEEREWDLYTSSLKPIGLATLLLTQCRFSKSVVRYEPHPKRFRHPLLRLFHGNCLCSLGRLIGFNDESLDAFITRKMILSSKRNLLASPNDHGVSFHTSVSVLVEDQTTRSLQLMTEGDPYLVLSHCSEYWDGDSIKPLLSQDRESLMEFYYSAIHRGIQVIALTYRPIPTSVKEDSLMDLTIIHDDDDDSIDANFSNVNEEEEFSFIQKTTITSNHKTLWTQLLRGQILIGLVSLQSEPRKVSDISNQVRKIFMYVCDMLLLLLGYC